MIHEHQSADSCYMAGLTIMSCPGGVTFVELVESLDAGACEPLFEMDAAESCELFTGRDVVCFCV